MRAAEAGRTKVLVANSMANLLRAGSNSLAQVALPLILFALLSSSVYSAWAVVFALATYVMYFDLGLGTSIQAKVASHDARGEFGAARVVGLRGAEVLGLVGVALGLVAVAIASSLPVLIPDLPASLAASAGWTLVILTFGQSAMLVSNGISSFYAGLQRSLAPAVLIASSRFISVGAAVSVAAMGGDLAALAIAYAVPSVVVLVVSAAWLIRIGGRTQEGWERRRSVHGADSHVELLKFSGPLMLWTLCALATNAFSPMVVARVDYQALPEFVVSTSIALGVMGAAQAILGPLLPELSRTVSGTPSRLQAVMKQSIQVGTLIPFGLGAAGLAIGTAIVGLSSARSEYGQNLMVLTLVVLAAAVRQSMTPVSLLIVAVRRHRAVKWQPLLDAFTSLVLAVSFGLVSGVRGVAVGVALSAVVGVGLTLGSAIPATGTSGLVNRAGLLRAVSCGAMCWTPIISSMFHLAWTGSTALAWSSLVVGTMLSFILLVATLSTDQLRAKVLALMYGRARRI